MDVHEIRRTDTGECICRMATGDDVIGEVLYERCIEKCYPKITPENDDELLEYTLVLDVDPNNFVEIRV